MARVRVPNHERRSVAHWLPPEELRLWDIEKEGKIDTPLDPNGLVDLDMVVQHGKQMVDPEFSWVSPFNDVHHLQWPGIDYRPDVAPEIAQSFRELTQRKTYVPRRFHNWLHHLMHPPLMPTEEVMVHAVKAEKATHALAATAQLAARLTRNPHIPEGKLIQRLEEELDLYALYIENARLVPKEFQLLKLAEVEANSIDELLEANRKLGKWALHHIPVRQRELAAA